MDFQEVDQGTHVVLVPEGKFNLVSAPPFKARIDELVAGGKARLVVDLHAVDFIDSSGLGALIGGLKSA
ncbi:MAG: STAS domain-containing protein, partial [Cellulomonas sp.]|nr:STAS domain-containing protein [Cellulomonas sp.]